MKEKIKTALRPYWKQAAVCAAFPVVLESILHLCVYGAVTSRMVYPCLFALALGAFLFMVSTLFEPRINRIVFLALTTALTLYAEIQLVYHSIFGEFMSLWQLSFGAEAVTNFWQQMIYGIWKALPKIAAVLLPQALLFGLICTGRIGLQFLKGSRRIQATALVLLAALHGSAVGVMALNDTGAFSVYQLYTNPDVSTEISVKNVGLFTTARLECKYLLFGGLREEKPAAYTTMGETVALEVSEQQRYNMLDIDFDALAQETDSTVLQNLDGYFSGREPTEKNDYTGMFAGYNLITICAESFSPYLIDPERTPTLYEMSTHGLVFQNYFGSFGSNTTNGEYAFCTGLYPDLSRDKSTASFYASQNNYLPFCLGNAFQDQGSSAWAYHNYTGEYYSRYLTHPNMGYNFQSATDGLDIEINWPSSDLEMMEASIDDYINSEEPFCAYYMTFSGHYQYNWDNPMSLKHKDAVADLPYSDTVKAYIACNLELEYALEYLMERLEEAGIADRTVIVLTNAHYPYGLTESEYNELAGKKVDTTFEKYRNSFLCYVPDMYIPVDTYCSTVDILPTLLNLFGLEYDSRLLAGRDVLSPQANDYAVLSDQSFLTPTYGFDTATGTVTYWTDDGQTVSDAELLEIQTEIANQFSVSADILKSDYYAHSLLGKQEAGAEVEGFPFTDIPATFSLGALEYLYGEGYMDAVSDTEFGFERPCTYGEFLDVLYRINGSPEMPDAAQTVDGSGSYGPAILWARENGLIDPAVTTLDDQTIITRKNASVTLYAYARYRQQDLTVEPETDAIDAAMYDGFTESEVEAITWCFQHMLLRGSGTLESVLKTAPNEMNRYQAVTALYNYSVYVEQ